MKIPELLAPAGSFKSIRAAVCGGADAVYFGGTAFNARRNAQNMSEAELRQAVAWCKKYKVKVYLTLNILIKDSEIPELMEALNSFKTLAIDGLIVQDPGLIYLLKKYFPEFRLQTSTQGSVYGLYGVRFFEGLGFERVVLPREMALEEVAEISKNTEAELKIFCHGALCYAFSGQCLMSSMIGGRSGNRGLCAQPCRKRYRLVNSSGKCIKEGFLLSPRDLNTQARMAEIIKSGVDSLKIEGRMKTPEYVYAVTKAYREALDGVPQNQREMDDYTLSQVFNRDFTQGRLFGDLEIINPVVGKNRGVAVGRVVGREKRAVCIGLAPDFRLAQGDGLAFGASGSAGVRIQKMTDDRGRGIALSDFGARVRVLMEAPPKENTPVYRNYDKLLMARLAEAAKAEPPLPEKIPLKMHIDITVQKPVKIAVEAGGKKLAFDSDIIPQKAERRGLTEAMVLEQFNRLGDTPYVLETLTISLGENLFLSKGQLNALRRAAIAALEDKADSEAAPVVLAPEDREGVERKPRELPLVSVQLQNLSDVDGLLETDVQKLILPAEDFSDLGALKGWIHRIHGAHRRAWLRFPRVMTTEMSKGLLSQMDEILQLGMDGIVVTNFEILEIFKPHDIPLEADQSMNFFNRFSAKAFEAWGFSGAVLSPELRGSEVRALSAQMDIAAVLPVYGRQELMISANCLINCEHKHCAVCTDRAWYHLEDGRGASFPMRRDPWGYTHIYNGDVLCLSGELKSQQFLDEWRIYAVDEDENRLAEIAGFYAALASGQRVSFPRAEDQHYTKGNYKRGVE
ncbi:MAG: DUF3656 domain-containing protein [Eubacterium sp.]|nr:DUF3656 domain-containing protein [Eubacterium sp.]